jgi:hypothetical protein
MSTSPFVSPVVHDARLSDEKVAELLGFQTDPPKSRTTPIPNLE